MSSASAPPSAAGASVRDRLAPRALWLLGAVVVSALAASLPVLGRLDQHTHGWPTFALLAAGAAVSQLFVVITPRNQSYHASIAFLVAAALLLPPELVVLMGLVQHVPEWLRLRYPWYIQTFNIANYTLSALAAWGAAHLVLAGGGFGSGRWALAATVASVVFVVVNHGLLTAMLHQARGHSIRAAGLFTAESLTTDGVLAALGVTVAALWHWNHWLVPFAVLPLVLAHRSLRVPALQEQARTDSKTGLLNPRAFTEALENELARATRFRRPLSVLVLDLDHLREVNNTYGHLAGDVAIAGVADALRRELRDYDVPSRFGGEEFAVLLPETAYAEALEIAERLRAAVADRELVVPSSGAVLHVTGSIGVASVPQHGESATTLLHRADLALYTAKGRGRNCVVGGDEVDPQESGESVVPVQAVATQARPVAAQAPAVAPASPAELHALAEHEDALAEIQAAAEPWRARREGGAVPGAAADSWSSSSLALRALVVLAAAMGLGGGLLGVLLGGSPEAWGILAVTALVATGQALALSAESGTLSAGAVGAIWAADSFGWRAVLGIAVAMAAVEWSARRSRPFQVAFNAGALSLAGLAAAGVCWAGHELSGSREMALGAAIVAGAAYYAVNVGLLTLAVALAEGERARAVWRERFSWLGPHYVAYGIVAGVLALAYREVGLYAVVVAAVPVLVLRRTQAAYLRRSADSATRLRAAAETIHRQNASLVEANRELRRRSAAALEGLSATVDARDEYTAGHSRRVRDLAVDIGRELGLGERELDTLGTAALFHDIGKLAVPDAILLKPGPLDPEEWAVMRAHPVESARIVSRLGHLADAVPAIRHHHERYDGGGYPDGLAGGEIPLGARIIHVADAVDAMLSPRTFRGARTVLQTIAELERCSGAQLCPEAVEAARRVLRRRNTVPVRLAG